MLYQRVWSLVALLLIGSCAQGKIDNSLEKSYESEMSDFMDMVPDPDGVEPEDIGIRGGFEEQPENILDALKDENEDAEPCVWNKCDKDFNEARGIHKYVDFTFLKKIVKNWNPFSSAGSRMQFYLFKREFPDCGQELDFTQVRKWRHSDFNASLPTRLIVHGWMSQSLGSFNRDVKNAYLKRGDYNVIVADWSASSANVNYFSVVKLIEEFGAQLAQFTRELHRRFDAKYDDMYVIGHSLGAQIAGAAGKRLKPEQYNTIFALDPAGPKFRQKGAEFRIDPTDAKYVESMHTSGNFGFLRPTGHATFYPNYGLYQRNCYYLGCSHIRSYQMFVESINSPAGFWGTPCTRHDRKWQCDETQRQSYQMGGEPAVHKSGIYYVKTASNDPFALGRR
ncbi:phospholipase A1 2 [Scaptodrosophila lebanonensis]|uniref:Phospholipase A1 2 n=1 Tax=Drosophila lebanonensis TaxID=7225 RepID=A0A6J2TQ47_DROLE|nr:phospholipase A1 2 [Scaptodrosophila lebanonensis]